MTAVRPIDEDINIRQITFTGARIANVFKPLCAKCMQLQEAALKGSPEDLHDKLNATLRALDTVEFLAKRLRAVGHANEREQQRYKQQEQQLNEEIEQAQRDIEHWKEELAKAQLVRQHREEYEVLRKLIAQEVPRAETHRRMDAVRADIAGLRAEQARAEATLGLRRKQFALLWHAVDELQVLHEEDGAAGAGCGGDGSSGGMAAWPDGGQQPQPMQTD